MNPNQTSDTGQTSRETNTQDPVTSPPPPQYYSAQRDQISGGVIAVAPISRADAVRLRKAGIDIVVCGIYEGENRRLAKEIESEANDTPIHCYEHRKTNQSRALPHFHPIRRHPKGHCFYETNTLKVVQKP